MVEISPDDVLSVLGSLKMFMCHYCCIDTKCCYHLIG
jgi:hypothetical protein